MHLVLALDGELSVRVGASRQWTRAGGVLTAPGGPHAIDAMGTEVLLVFLDPQSEAGAALLPVLSSPVHLVSREQAATLSAGVDPLALMREGGVEWTSRVAEVLGGAKVPPRPAPHPRVRKLLRLLREPPADADTSLESLAEQVGLSPGRLMHVFTESIGLPLRPYLSWLRLQRAAAAIVGGRPLSEAAYAAGFSDAAHMSRTFRRMLGMAPSALRDSVQPVRSSR